MKIIHSETLQQLPREVAELVRDASTRFTQ